MNNEWLVNLIPWLFILAFGILLIAIGLTLALPPKPQVNPENRTLKPPRPAEQTEQPDGAAITGDEA